MNHISLPQFEGCLLGLALGDALGAPHEGGAFERFLWRMIGTTRQGEIRWTDDTQMSLDLGESLVARGFLDADDIARRFAASYRWSRGYGPGAAKQLKMIGRGMDWRQANRAVFPEGSFGNGGAMRVPLLGLLYANKLDEAVNAARLTANITHAHPLGIEGAVLVAKTTALAACGSTPNEVLQDIKSNCLLEPFLSRLSIAARWLQSTEETTPASVAKQLGNGIAASESCVTAIYLALRFLEQPFERMLAFIAACRGDVDTIGAMAGGIWGAVNGVSQLPADKIARLEQTRRLKELAAALYEQQI